MRISDLIKALEKQMAEYGDLEVQANNECGDASRIASKEYIYTYTNLLGQRLLLIDA